MTRLVSVVVDANDHIAQARWWAQALDTPVTTEADDEAGIAPPDAPLIDFVPVPEPKTTKNRVHFDLATYSMHEHDELLAKLLDIGARRIDVGQAADADWEVLTDPEGNEFCVVQPRAIYGHPGRIAEIGVETASLPESVDFWQEASGWRTLIRNPTWAVLRSPMGSGPYLVFGATDISKVDKNRIHLDVAPLADGDHAAEVDRLVAAGAQPVDIGQTDVAWVVLADPGGNEFCVLTPR